LEHAVTSIPKPSYAGRRSSLLLFAILIASAGQTADLPVHDGVGGEFALPSSLGREVRLSEYRGKVVLLFFGYTSCPDICPANLAHLRTLTRRLGPAADRTQVILVTVDPETDTAEHLKEYLARFDERFVGLTGARDEIDRVAKLFMLKHDKSHPVEVTMQHNRSKAFTEKGFLYAHSQQIYLLDKQGRTRGLYFAGSPLADMKTGVLALLEE
jgi:protein SCO1/2